MELSLSTPQLRSAMEHEMGLVSQGTKTKEEGAFDRRLTRATLSLRSLSQRSHPSAVIRDSLTVMREAYDRVDSRMAVLEHKVGELIEPVSERDSQLRQRHLSTCGRCEGKMDLRLVGAYVAVDG